MFITNQFIKNIFTEFARPLQGSRNHFKYSMFSLIYILYVFFVLKKKKKRKKKTLNGFVFFGENYKNC